MAFTFIAFHVCLFRYNMVFFPKYLEHLFMLQSTINLGTSK